MTTVKNIYDYIDRYAPFSSQEEWDNSGFIIGDFRKEVRTVVMSLDATNEAVEYAKSVGADLLLTHHPLIFGGLNSIPSDSKAYKLIKSDIAVICAHTNFDRAEFGISTNLADILGLNNVHQQENGFVAVGELDEAMSIDDFAEFVGDRLSSSGLRYTDTDRLIKKVAVAGGSGADFIADAMSEADCFVTGDLKYHDMLDSSEQGYAVISGGHFETECEPFLMLKGKLASLFTDVEFIIAPINNAVHGL